MSILKKLSSLRKRVLGTRQGTIPAGERIYAIGDIHGRLDLLDDLLIRIAADDQSRPEAQTTLIFLGDLVDRGPQSAQVVERVRSLASTETGVRLLLGNHEEVFLKALSGDIDTLRFFTKIGGKETIISYGITPTEYDQLDYSELADAFRSHVPAAHRTFLEGAEDMIIIGDYVFVHAGIRPQTSLTDQKAKDLRWIREDFLRHEGPLERIVVHGHTISEEIEWAESRIGLDTGAYMSGRLSALALEGSERWTLEAALPA